jgi:hypothetical protein
MPRGLAPDPMLAILFELFRRVDQSLGWDATDIEAGSAELLRFHQYRIDTGWPARIAQTYPPGPPPITNNLQAMSFMASAFHEDQRRRLEQRLDALHEARRIETIYDAMIKARGQVHHLAGNERDPSQTGRTMILLTPMIATSG